MATRTFCTLADSNYRAKLLVLHHTLCQHVPDFRLYILCLDNALYQLLSQLALENVSLIDLDTFMDPALAAARESRTLVEWYWTMTPSLALWVMSHHRPEALGYIDADLALFSSLEPMYEEVGGANSMVIPHRFPPGRDKSENGLYNVSLVWWRNAGEETIKHLREWRYQCLEWCHCWPSKGRFADQGYLNDWPQRWGSHVLQHLGCNLAPWNMGQYGYTMMPEGRILIDTLWPLVFFHFHEFRITNEWAHDFFRCNYKRPPFVDRYIYPQYERMLKTQIERIRPYVQPTR